MGEERFKKLYDSLLECDELYEMFHGMKGVWEKDKVKFIRVQKEMENQVNFIDLDE